MNPGVINPRADILESSWAATRLQKRFADKIRTISMELRIVGSLPHKAILDSSRACQVLNNLLGCAPENPQKRLSSLIPTPPCVDAISSDWLSLHPNPSVIPPSNPPYHPPLPLTPRNRRSNAIKFTPEGGRVEMVAECDASGLLSVSIIDTGRGLSQEGLEKLFKPFSQV